MWYKWFYRAPLFIILIGAVLLLIGYVVMVLWNALVPGLFHGPLLTFWQAIGLIVLVKILFHNHRVHGWHGHGWHPSYHRHWKNRFEAKLASMNPEEKERFKEEWQKRCNPRYWDHCCSPDEHDASKTEKAE
jgi:hypothetical protein